MKKVLFKTYSYALLVTTLAVFLFSCANPVQFDATSDVGSKSLYAPTLISDSNNKDVLNMKNGTTIDSAKLEGQPSEDGTLGPVTFTKIYYKGTEAIGFDFVSTKPVLAVYVKASTGGNLYSYPAPGAFGDTELYTPVNPTNQQNYGISHVDFAWATEGTPPTTTTTVPANPTLYSISGVVFHDKDNSGTLNNDETGLGGVTLTLSTGATDTTDPDGSYSFSSLAAGSYTVSSGGKANFWPTPYSAPVTEKAVTLPESATDQNFGLSYETIKGVVFYDSNRDDTYQAGEPLLEGFKVRLGNVEATSAADGSYTFDYLIGEKEYTVSADDRTGFVHSVAASRTLTPAYGVPAVANFGFAVDYNWIVGKTANGFTIGYWKTNLDKAIANKTAGTQVSKAKLLAYVNQLSTFALSPLNVATMAEASGILSATGSAPTLLLSKQLMGSEFNYASGAYIGGNALATEFFLYDGEYMLANSGSFTSAQLLAQKDRYDAYNNSHGGAVLF